MLKMNYLTQNDPNEKDPEKSLTHLPTYTSRLWWHNEKTHSYMYENNVHSRKFVETFKKILLWKP